MSFSTLGYLKMNNRIDKKEQSYILNNENDVINLGNDAEKFFVEIPMLKLGDLLQNIKLKLLHISHHDWQKKQNENWIIGRKQWLYEGKNCELLHLGATNWKRGRVKINVTVEFYPDEPEETQSESPLDDIRKTINEDNR